MDNVIEEDVMVESIHDMPNYRRQNKTVTTKKSIYQATDHHWITENVSLSQTSRQMEALKVLILSDPEIQASKMAFIKEAIAEGRYEAHCDKIAEKMLADIF